MSKSYKREERAQARAVQQRRDARHSKIEWHDNFGEWILCKNTVVDVRPGTKHHRPPAKTR